MPVLQFAASPTFSGLTIRRLLLHYCRCRAAYAYNFLHKPIREQRPTLEQMNWTVHEIGGQGHGVCMAPELVVPPVRDFLDLLAI